MTVRRPAPRHGPGTASGPHAAPRPRDRPAPGDDPARPDADDTERRRPPAGAVLGPLPGWAATAVVAALAGEVLALQATRPASVAVVTAGVAVAAGVAVVVALRVAMRTGRTTTAGRSAAAGLAATAVVAGAVIAGVALRVDTVDRGLLPALAAHGGSAEVRVTVVHEPRPIASGWHLLVRVDEVDGTRTRERAAITLDAEPPALGARWAATVTARPLPDGGYGRWLARQHATVVVDLHRWEPVGRPDVLARASEHVRDRVRRSGARHLPDRLAGLLAGFVTGDTRRLPDDDAEAMRATGLTHLTAVSGSNVAIVVAGVLGLCVLVRLGASGRRRVVAGTVVWFAFVTRFEPSVLRAGTMALLVLLASARGVPRDARHALAGAVLVLVLVDPLLAGSLGLLLSATATAGVLAVAPVVRRRLERLPRRVADLASITIGAQVAVVPILLVTFGEVSLASVPANLVAVPAAALAAATGFAASAVGLLHLEAGAWLFWLAGQPARVVLWSAHTFRDAGGTATTGAPISVLALLAGCAWLLTGPRTAAARWTAAACAVLLVVASVPYLSGRVVPPSDLVVTAIDVGQGDAFLVESPGARLLVDAGGDDSAARWLAANGRTRLDLVVATHAHLDHVGGVPEVLRRARVAAVWFRPMPSDLPAVAEVFEVAGRRGVPVRGPVAGDLAVVGDLLVEVLGPPPGRPYRWSGSEHNDSSLVLRVTWQDRRVLLTGDVEHTAQTDLLADPDRFRAELFTVPHHGAGTSEPAFLAAVGAQVGLIGVGVDNPYGHPHAEVLTHLDALGVTVHRTDLDGTVRVAVPAPRRPLLPGMPPAAGDGPAAGTKGHERPGEALPSPAAVTAP